MPDPQKEGVHVDRRQFLRLGVAGAAASHLIAGSSTEATEDSPGPPSASVPAGIPARPFGKTGHTLPILGMGGSAMVDRWAPSYGVATQSIEARAAMVRHAYDRGVRYFDTARVYFEGETIVGLGLHDIRKDVFLATKVATHDPDRVRASLETSLKELRTDHVDLVQIHSPAIERVGWKEAMKLHEQLVKLRDEKLVRFIGLTTHVAFEDVYQMICTGGFDQVLLAYGYFNKGMDTLLSNRNLEYRNLCLSRAHELGMAIVAMKVMGASIFGHNARNLVPGHDPQALVQLPAAAIRWVLQDSRINMLNIGVSVASDIDRNIEVLCGDLRFTDLDQHKLADHARRCYDHETIKQMRTV
jgi:aryl-alcohol dehydrogenase-like predicted oxidoreductase